jgi:hypothetical protein
MERDEVWCQAQGRYFDPHGSICGDGVPCRDEQRLIEEDGNQFCKNYNSL